METSGESSIHIGRPTAGFVDEIGGLLDSWSDDELVVDDMCSSDSDSDVAPEDGDQQPPDMCVMRRDRRAAYEYDGDMYENLSGTGLDAARYWSRLLSDISHNRRRETLRMS